jgi:hypothetical protein
VSPSSSDAPPGRLRLYDPARRPPSWTEIIRPDQFAMFAKEVETGAPCDEEGQVFADPAAAACLLFDSLEAARRFAEEQVLRAPRVRIEIFDGAGRTRPPLVVVVHPSRAHTLTANPRAMRWRTVGAVLLVAGALPLMWYDYQRRGLLVLPTVLAINMILLAVRLVQMNMTVREVERTRRAREAGVRS